MKLLHTADIHLGMPNMAQPGKPYSRLDDLDAVLNRFCAAAAEHKPDLAIIVGDLFDGRKPEPRAIAVATRFLEQLSLFTEWVLLDGNHDGRWVISDPGSATLRMLAEIDWERGQVITSPGITTLVAGETVQLVSVPYPHKRAYDVSRPDLTDDQERHETLSNDLENAITALYEEAVASSDSVTPIIFAGHLTAVGAVAGSERTMRLENDVSVGSHVLDLFDYAALGHIHKQQQIGQKAWYAGAPEWVDFGEAGQSKGFLLVDVERGQLPKVTVIPSNPRPMELFEGDADIEAGIFDAPADLAPGAIVRLRLHYPDRSSSRASRITEQQFYLKGASYVQTEVIVPERAEPTERALERASTPVDALTAYCSWRGLEPEVYVAAFQSLIGPAQ